MAVSASKDDLYGVADCTDWLGTPLSSLSSLENALRCLVCRDFFRTPMITSCSHTFCSVCIRRCLTTEGKCPVCRAPEQEHKLRRNWSLEQVVDEFQRARPSAITYAREAAIANRPSSPKRKLDEIDLDDNAVTSSKRTRSSSRQIGKSSHRGQVTESNDEVIEEDYADDGLVACPVCSLRVKMEKINDHIDICTNESPNDILAVTASISRTGSPTPSKTKGPIFRPNPLPKLNYSLLKEAALRKKLAELGISTVGNRQLLERRHTEWVIIWNANCDAAKPRPKQQLLQELDIWDRTQGGRAPSTNNGLNTASHVRNENFDRDNWSTKHGQSFQDLIEQARRRVQHKSKITDSNQPGYANQPKDYTAPPDSGQDLLVKSNPTLAGDTTLDECARRENRPGPGDVIADIIPIVLPVQDLSSPRKNVEQDKMMVTSTDEEVSMEV